MIDIGANVGQTSTAFMDYICKGPCTSQSACRGKPNVGVIAFEPQRATFEAINDLAARNKWHLCGWTAQNKAVSNAPGTMQLYGGNTHASLNQDAAWLDRQGFGENKTETVVVTTVDEVVEAAGIKHIFLLKIGACWPQRICVVATAFIAVLVIPRHLMGRAFTVALFHRPPPTHSSLLMVYRH